MHCLTFTILSGFRDTTQLGAKVELGSNDSVSVSGAGLLSNSSECIICSNPAATMGLKLSSHAMQDNSLNSCCGDSCSVVSLIQYLPRQYLIVDNAPVRGVGSQCDLTLQCWPVLDI